MRLPTLIVGLCAAFLVNGCSGTSSARAEAPVALRVEVLDTLAHDTDLFTQGFEIADGVLYEGTGRVGASLVRATPLADPGRVVAEAALPEPLFGEGVTVVGDRIWQLTWRDGVALERDRATLDERRRVRYAGEGWGLCFDGARLVMSDGSPTLTFRDPVSFAPRGVVVVRETGTPVAGLNELECTGGAVWANVFGTDRIVRIDPETGMITGTVDASGLLTPQQRSRADVLNGIAAIPGTDEFLLTGKLWPTTFRARFVPV